MNRATELSKMNDAKVDKMIDDVSKSHQACPMGRKFIELAFKHKDKKSRDSYRDNFDKCFPSSPGAGI